MKTTAVLVPALGSLLSLAGVGMAEDLVFPFVDVRSEAELTNFWGGFEAEVVDVKDSLTTYSVGCATYPCGRYSLENPPSYTVVMNSETFDFRHSRSEVSFHTACTFSGNPVTAASCEDTVDWALPTESGLPSDYESHWTVPASDSLWAIVSATWKLVDGTVTPTGTPTPGASGTSGSAKVTPAPTATGPETSAQTPASVQSSGMAQGTGAPAAKFLAGMGIAAGAMFAL